ncbi:MAG: penicillin-binding protein 2 [Chitinophagales bacterium]|nr:penicillin-binding protein 2 [Chitinophagales bacterium]
MKDIALSRSTVIQAIIILASLVFIIRLSALQIFDDSYKVEASKNAVKKRKIYANRGLIYDRNNKLIVYNDAIYDLYVIPGQVKQIDTTKFCNLVGLSRESFQNRLAKCRKYSPYKASVFMKQVPAEVYSHFQEHMREFKGFYGQVRAIRRYPYRSAPHTLGDVGEVDSITIMQSAKYYQAGDYIGKSGLEKIYENYLRGEVGVKYIFVDALNREQGKFKDGELDTVPKAGLDIFTTLDIDLQQYGEKLMKNKRGSIVAIEPSTGEILALISSPGFDPNLLCGRQRGDNFKILSSDTLKPLFNRPIMAQYPPGSTFKALVALVALQNDAISKNFSYYCPGYYTIPGYMLRCSHAHPSAKNVVEGLQHSCNPYFWQSFRNSLDKPEFENFEASYQNWYDYVRSFGLGNTLSIDLPGEKPGNIPAPSYYNKLYGNGAWKSTTVISLGIGQGEVLMTPLQLANLYASIANRGFYITPHLMKAYKKDGSFHFNNNIEKKTVPIDKQHFDIVAEGLAAVVDRGTGRRSKMRDIEICGKTGTAENPHGEDHSIFAGFGPFKNPKIAVAVIVENAGGGSRYAAPISSLMIEKFINDTIADYRKHLEAGILEANLIKGESE